MKPVNRAQVVTAVRYMPPAPGATICVTAEPRTPQDAQAIRAMFLKLARVAPVRQISDGDLISFAINTLSALDTKEFCSPLHARTRLVIIETCFTSHSYETLKMLACQGGVQLESLLPCEICTSPAPFAAEMEVRIEQTEEERCIRFCSRCNAILAKPRLRDHVRSLLEQHPGRFRLDARADIQSGASERAPWLVEMAAG